MPGQAASEKPVYRSASGTTSVMQVGPANVVREPAEVVDRIVKVVTEVEAVGGGLDLFLEP